MTMSIQHSHIHPAIDMHYLCTVYMQTIHNCTQRRLPNGYKPTLIASVILFCKIAVFNTHDLTLVCSLKFYCLGILYRKRALAYSGELLKVKGLKLPTAWLIA